MFQTTMRALRQHFWWAGLGAALLSGCGGGGGDDPVAREDAQARPSYSVGGTITLNVPLPDQDNDLFNLILADGLGPESFRFRDLQGGNFTFARKLFRRDMYNVTVSSSVGGYNCSVTENGSGTIVRSDVTNVVVTCLSNVLYDVPFSVTGLPPNTSVLIRNNFNPNNQRSVTIDGSYTFPVPQVAGGSYYVTVENPQPAGAICAVSGTPNGTVTPDMQAIPVVCTATTP